MKHVTFILFALSFLLSLPAFARVGETMEQCEARYGKAVRVNDNGGIYFQKGVHDAPQRKV